MNWKPLECLMEAKLWIIKTILHIEESLWIYKNNILLVSINNPDDKIWVEILCFEESDSLPTQISEEIEIFSGEGFYISLIVFLHLEYKLSFSFIQRNRGYYSQFRREVLSKSEKRTIEMSIEVK